MTDDPNMTAKEIGIYLRCSEAKARRLMASGEIDAAKIADRWIAKKSAVDAYQDRLTTSKRHMARRRRRRAS